MRLLAICLIIGFSACHPISDEGVCGSYSADYGFAQERLLLNRGGSYQQLANVDGSTKTFTQSGTWKYSVAAGRIVMGDRFMLLAVDGKFNPKFENPEVGIVSLPVSWMSGETYIGSEEAIRYQKKDKCRP